MRQPERPSHDGEALHHVFQHCIAGQFDDLAVESDIGPFRPFEISSFPCSCEPPSPGLKFLDVVASCVSDSQAACKPFQNSPDLIDFRKFLDRGPAQIDSLLFPPFDQAFFFEHAQGSSDGCAAELKTIRQLLLGDRRIPGGAARKQNVPDLAGEGIDRRSRMQDER